MSTLQQGDEVAGNGGVVMYSGDQVNSSVQRPHKGPRQKLTTAFHGIRHSCGGEESSPRSREVWAATESQLRNLVSDAMAPSTAYLASLILKFCDRSAAREEVGEEPRTVLTPKKSRFDLGKLNCSLRVPAPREVGAK